MNGENKGRKIDDVCSQHGTKWNERKNEMNGLVGVENNFKKLDTNK